MGNKIKDDEMGRARATYGQRKGGREIHIRLWFMVEKAEQTGRPRCVDRMIILK